MDRPPFSKITSHGLDGFLQVFFLDYLGYAKVDEIDPDAKDRTAPDAWRLVRVVADAKPFMIGFQHGLSAATVPELRKLHAKRVLAHYEGPRSLEPVLYGLTDGLRLVLFDPRGNRDDRFDLSEETWRYAGVREKVELLHRSRLEPTLKTRLGQKQPSVAFLFELSPLSADARFTDYMKRLRERLMEFVLADHQALAAVLYHLVEPPGARDAGKTTVVKSESKLAKKPEELLIELGSRLGDAVAAAVDTLLLRHVVIRMVETTHPEVLEGMPTTTDIMRKAGAFKASLSEGTAKALDTKVVAARAFREEEIAAAGLLDPRPGRKAPKGQGELFGVEDAASLEKTLLAQEAQRAKRLGGDFYLADLGEAARKVEERLLVKRNTGAALLRDYLVRTGSPEAQWEFRYEDLRPNTLQEFYEHSLGTTVDLRYEEANKRFTLSVGKSQRQRKELGAYYTHSTLCRYMVEQTVKPLFEERLDGLRRAIAAKDDKAAAIALRSIVGMSICDPTMGSAPFLRAAFEYLTAPSQYQQLCRAIREAATALPAWVKDVEREYPYLGPRNGHLDEDGIGRWEWHVLRRMLYGVDIDLKAVCIACQTFALSALCHLRDGERFPSFFNINLKVGNALINPLISLRAREDQLAAKHGPTIAKLIELRRQAMTLPSTESAYPTLTGLLQQCQALSKPIHDDLVKTRVVDILGEYTDELRPFCWELEFPEVFFGADGSLKADPGFDVVIGNPPWDAIKYHDAEFLEPIGAKGDDVEKLAKRKPAVKEAYRDYRGVLEAWKEWVGKEGSERARQYEHQQGGRDRNKWRLATEVSWKMTRVSGAMSLVVPGGIVADEGGAALKQWIFPEGEATTLISFDEANDVFAGTQGFTIIGFRRGTPTERVRHLEGLTRAEQLLAWPYQPASVSLATTRRMSPDILAIPSVRDDVDASILEKLYRHPLITDGRGSWSAQTVSYDYHMQHGREAFKKGGRIVLLEGKSIEQYEVKPVIEIEKRVPVRVQEEPGGQYRIACADVAGTLLVRRMLCSLVPHGYATGDKLNCFLVSGSNNHRLYLVGVLNALTTEWRVRQLARSNNIKKFMLAQLPIPRPAQSEIDRIAGSVAALMTNDARFADLKPFLVKRQPASDPAERHDLKCRIDAEVARLFGLTDAELERVLEAFDRVPEAYKVKVRSEFQDVVRQFGPAPQPAAPPAPAPAEPVA